MLPQEALLRQDPVFDHPFSCHLLVLLQLVVVVLGREVGSSCLGGEVGMEMIPQVKKRRRKRKSW